MRWDITASMLYDWMFCPHKVYSDLFGDKALKEQPNAFMKLLWEKGNLFETKTMNEIGILYTDLSHLNGKDREQATIDAMNRGDQLIYSGRIRYKNLLGIPDLLRRDKDGYLAGDIKSGAGDEGASDLENGTPKKHYAMQLAFYTDILEKTGFLSKRSPFIWDISGREIEYNLDLPANSKTSETLWQIYQQSIEGVKGIVDGKEKTTPAYSSRCKLCHWRSHCKKALIANQDLTLIPGLGRSTRDKMIGRVKDIEDLAGKDIGPFLKGKKTIFRHIKANTLKKFQKRATLLSRPNSRPVIQGNLSLPESNVELFFDVETDPMRDICYLHGFWLRISQGEPQEAYFAFFADNPTDDEERDAFEQAVEFIRSHQPCLIYYYSKYERTIWRKLQQKYPDVITSMELESFFSAQNSVDLFEVVNKKTEWPTYDYSIKTLAQYLGFSWRDEDPSGASSIEWYHRWVNSKNEQIKKRILDYNEDDCIATRVLLDGIRKFS